MVSVAPPYAARRPHLGAGARVAGMSLLEMLLVVALIALVGLLTVGMFSRGTAGMQLRGAGKEIASQLRLARTQAIASGQPQRFIVEPAHHRWQGAGGRTGNVPPQLQMRFEGAAQLQEKTGEGVIEFHPDGGSSGGMIALRQGEARWTIRVGWLTGDVVSGPERTP